MQWLQYAVDYGITGLLVVICVIALTIGVERYVIFRKVRIEEYPDRKGLELH